MPERRPSIPRNVLIQHSIVCSPRASTTASPLETIGRIDGENEQTNEGYRYVAPSSTLLHRTNTLFSFQGAENSGDDPRTRSFPHFCPRTVIYLSSRENRERDTRFCVFRPRDAQRQDGGRCARARANPATRSVVPSIPWRRESKEAAATRRGRLVLSLRRGAKSGFSGTR